MAGYIRQSTFVDGDTITAALFNNEYNQLVNAFSNTSGHKHDGTTAEGPVIGLIGDAGETSPNNKVLIDTTNNYIEFYVEVSSAPVQQLYIADGAIIPVTDSDIDLGTTSLRFKDTYTDTVTTTGNVSIGGDLTVTGSATISGNLTFGDADTDSINLAAEIDSNIVPNTDDTYDLGTSTKQWRNLYIDGTAEIDTLAIDGTTVTSTAAELNILDGVTSTAAELNILDGVTSTTAELNILDGVTASATDINLIDGITNGTVIASKAIVTDANKDISGGRNITITGELDAATLDISGNADIDGTLETDALSINGTIVTSTAAELNILDGVTSTATEINIVDGDTAATSTTLADADRVVVNDAGTMKQVALTDFETYFEGALDTLSNVTTVGALNAGSITSGFGSIDNGSSAITTTGTVTYGSLSDGTITITAFADEDDMSSNSATLVPTQQSVKAYVDSQVTAQDLDATTDSGTIAIDLDSETLTIAGGEGIDTSAATNTITIAGEDASTTNKGIASFSSDDFTVSSGAVSLATTSTAAELNILDGATVTTAELNILDGVTSTAAELNILDGVTSTTAELNILDGVTSTAAELNILDGKAFLDEDNMASNSATGIASQQSIKAYVDTEVGAVSTDVVSDTTPQLGGNLDLNSSDITGTGDINITGTVNGLNVAAGSIATSTSQNFAINTPNSLRINIDSNNSATDQIFVIGHNQTAVDNNNSLMTILESGNVGIGTSSPNFTLQLDSTRADATFNADNVSTWADFKIQADTAAGNARGIYFDFDSDTGNDKGAGIVGISGDATGGVGSLGFITSAGNVSAERMRIDSSGNVGIGTTPTYRLDVTNNSSGIQGRFSSSSSSGTSLSFQNSATNGRNYRIGSNFVTGAGEFSIYDDTASAERMRIDSSGNVGIGTTSPSGKLSISDSGATGVEFSPDDSNARVQQLYYDRVDNAYRTSLFDAGDYQFRISGTEKMRIDSSGNVGIGTSSPTRTFEVNSGTTNVAARFESTDSRAVVEFKDPSGTAELGGIGSDIYFAPAGAEKVRITSAGNLLVGATSFNAGAFGSASGINVAGTQPLVLVHETDTDKDGFMGISNSVMFLGTADAIPLRFSTNDTERMRILSTGEVHITSGGVAITPTTKHSGATGDVAKLRLINRSGQSANKGGLVELGAVTNDGVDRSDVLGSVAGLKTNATSGDMQGYLQFSTNTGSALSEAMRIDSSGRVAIGTTDAGNAKLVITGTGVSAGSDAPCIDFDNYGNYGTGASQSINFRMGRTGQATDQPASIKAYFPGGGATATATHIGFLFTTISANTQIEQFYIDSAYQRFKFNTSESPRSNNPQTNNCLVLGPSTSTAVTAGLTNATVLINRGGELYAVDSSHNNTQLTPHNWTLIPEGPSEELAWTYWSQRPNPDNPDQLQGINVDMAKVVRKVEDLVGEKLVYTENSNMDDHTHQSIIADIQSTLANLTTRIEALEG